MMQRTTTQLAVSIVACAAAAILFVRALSGALDTGPANAGTAAHDSVGGESMVANAHRMLSSEALQLAVDGDPFQPDRRRHPVRYRLPGDFDPPPPPRPPPPPPPPPFRLVGTGMASDGGVAVIEVDNTARILSVGESYLGYTLTSVESDYATLTGSEQAVRLPLVASAAGARAGNSGAAGGGGRGAPAGRGNATARPGAPPVPAGATPAAQELRELVERIRASGGNLTPQMLELIQRMQAEGRDIRFETGTGGTMMIRTTRPDTSETTIPRTY